MLGQMEREQLDCWTNRGRRGGLLDQMFKEELDCVGANGRRETRLLDKKEWLDCVYSNGKTGTRLLSRRKLRDCWTVGPSGRREIGLSWGKCR